MRLRNTGLWLLSLVAGAGSACSPGLGSASRPSLGPASSHVVEQRTVPAPAPFADSLVTVIEGPFGTDSGFLSEHFQRSINGYRLVESQRPGAGAYDATEVFFDPRMVVDSVRAQRHRRGRVVDFDVTYRGRDVSGWLVAGQADSSHRSSIATVLPDSAFDTSALMALLPTLPWRVGTKRALYEFNPENATTQTVLLTVVGEDQVTVPAGTFDAFRAELTKPGGLEYWWYTARAPHRCVKVVSVTNRWHAELVSYVDH